MKLVKPLLLFAFLVLSGVATAQDSSHEFGNYRVLYNAFSADVLTPEVAKSYHLPRGSHHGIINIVVQEKDAKGGYRAREAVVNATGVNLADQFKRIPLREVREGDAIYYIGSFIVADGEVINFDVKVQPKGSKAPMEVRFRREFYTSAE